MPYYTLTHTLLYNHNYVHTKPAIIYKHTHTHCLTIVLHCFKWILTGRRRGHLCQMYPHTPLTRLLSEIMAGKWSPETASLNKPSAPNNAQWMGHSGIYIINIIIKDPLTYAAGKDVGQQEEEEILTVLCLWSMSIIVGVLKLPQTLQFHFPYIDKHGLSSTARLYTNATETWIFFLRVKVHISMIPIIM